MSTATVLAKKKPAKSKKRNVVLNRPTVEPTRNYSRHEGSLAIGVSNNTLIRAFEKGHLKGYRVGRRVLHSGQMLLDWIAAGGKTGYTKETREMEAAEK